jgi:hypothetical protein
VGERDCYGALTRTAGLVAVAPPYTERMDGCPTVAGGDDIGYGGMGSGVPSNPLKR